MGMLKKNTTGLKRKPNPVISNQLDRNELNIGKMLQNTTVKSEKLGVTSSTERATVKVDNHIRNILTTFVNIGRFDSQKDAIEKLCNEEIESLTPDERKRFDFIFDSLELKDYSKQQRKTR